MRLPRNSRAPGLRRLADEVLAATSPETLARLLTEALPAALGIRGARVLLWDRKLDTFETLLPGETRLTRLEPGEAAPGALPEAGFLLTDGSLIETPMGGGQGVLVPLQARSGLVGMLVLDASAGRRRVPFRPVEVRLLTVLASRAGLALENYLYQRELVASERLAALGAFAGMLAHDLRNPMAVISGYADLIARADVDPEVRSQAEIIVRTTARVDRMIQETLDYARAGGRLARRPLDFAAWLEEVGAGLEQELPGLTVVRRADLPPGASAAVDADKLRRALANIAANARDAMGGRGRLHLSAHLEDAPKRLVLLVGDEGPGVPEELRERLFEPFVTSGKKGGTGLGLAIARRFVEDHGGAIELCPPGPAGQEPTGAVFRMTLPLQQEGDGGKMTGGPA